MSIDSVAFYVSNHGITRLADMTREDLIEALKEMARERDRIRTEYENWLEEDESSWTWKRFRQTYLNDARFHNCVKHMMQMAGDKRLGVKSGSSEDTT